MSLLVNSLSFLPPVERTPVPPTRICQSSRLSQSSASSQRLSSASKTPPTAGASSDERFIKHCVKTYIHKCLLKFKNFTSPRSSSGLRISCSEEEKVSLKEEIVTSDRKSSLFLPIREDTIAPFVGALKAYAESDASELTFPGHNRGMAAPPLLEELIGKKPFLHDIGEVEHFISAQGAILDAQKKAAELFGATETWFLVGGTTCGVETSIMSTCSPGDTLILPRNSHKSAISGLVLSGASPKYIVPEYNAEWEIAGRIRLHQVAKAIDELNEEGKEPAAVFIASPTYHGICGELGKIIDLCRRRRIPVIVDEAHGAHFKFDHRLPSTALEQGADLVVQSTHKVLCSLSQSSMLHLSGCRVDRERTHRCLQTLESTSPSYLLLASLDAATAQLSKNPYTIFDTPISPAYKLEDEVRSLIPNASFLQSNDFEGMPEKDPLRVTIDTWELGLPGYEAYKILREKYYIFPGLGSQRSVTFAVGLGTCRDHVQRLMHGIKDIATVHGPDNSRRPIKNQESATFGEISIKISPRDAFFAKKRRMNVEESVGQICGELICTLPPGIPVLIPGEEITHSTLSYLLNAKDRGAAISGAADSNLDSITVCDI
ncbi:unnamed protein product [Victoria cruziana]